MNARKTIPRNKTISKRERRMFLKHVALLLTATKCDGKCSEEKV